MTTATEQRAQSDKTPAAESVHALLFELEGLVGSARQATHDILKSILREHGIELLPVHIARFCLQPSPSLYVEALLEGTTLAGPYGPVAQAVKGLRFQEALTGLRDFRATLP